MGERGDRCGGTGTWELEPVLAGEAQQVEVHGDCPGRWDIGGTEDRPTLFYFLGDPDEWHRYVLTRRGGVR
ncbi:hypothetical protein ACH4SK_09390 [Streptomyces inhibens]|uniref:hypothetical protein n=1 Tax=Streptomyces inhibens TaxID=2293571 RepID=UPI00378EA08D